MRIYSMLFLLWALASCDAYSPAERAIGIQPLGPFPTVLADSVQASLARAYQVEVHLLPAMPLPKAAFVNVKSPRYRADSLLRYLKR